MKTQLLHLNGPQRGRTVTYPGPRVLIGSSTAAECRFPPHLDAVADEHAEIRYHEEGCAFHLRAIDGDVFVNRKQVREVILEHRDLLEIGIGGPKLRFRIQADKGRTCKPVREMLTDARDVQTQSGIFPAGRALSDDLLKRSTWSFRIALPLIVIAIAFLGAWIGGAMSRPPKDEAERAAEEIRNLRQLVETLREDQSSVKEVSRETIAKLQGDLARQREVLDGIARRDEALGRVLTSHVQAVCLLHGIYHMTAETVEGTWEPMIVDGDELRIEYFGSGFLVEGGGRVVTNRHVAEPWWRNDTIRPLIDAGLRPAWVSLTAYFPGRAATSVDTDRIRLSRDDVDVAVLEGVAADGVQPVPLHGDDLSDLRGQRIIVAGYPTGVRALLARAESNVLDEVMEVAVDNDSLLTELARRRLISPIITQGALNEVINTRLVYDAATTSGGSGGPVFGPDGTVVGVNFAITADFDGSNFGVPVSFIRKMLSE